MAKWNKQDIELIEEFIDSGKSISFIAAISSVKGELDLPSIG